MAGPRRRLPINLLVWPEYVTVNGRGERRHGRQVGTRREEPQRPHCELLCLLYGATPEYLGIARVTKSKTSSSPKQASPAVTEQSLVDALGGAAAILDQLGPAGGILQPRMFEA